MPMRRALSLGDGPGIVGAICWSKVSINTLIGSIVMPGKTNVAADSELTSLICALVDDEPSVVIVEVGLDDGAAVDAGCCATTVTIVSSVVTVGVVVSAGVELPCDFCDLPRRCGRLIDTGSDCSEVTSCGGGLARSLRRGFGDKRAEEVIGVRYSEACGRVGCGCRGHESGTSVNCSSEKGRSGRSANRLLASASDRTSSLLWLSELNAELLTYVALRLLIGAHELAPATR